MQSERLNVLIENGRTAREELLFRVKHRDHWLKLQLLAQITILALAGGIEVGAFAMKPLSPLPNAMALSVPIAFVLTCLYFVEDRLIGFLSTYIGRLSVVEGQLSANTPFDNWDSSEELRSYAKTTLPFRAYAQFVSFVVVPTGITVLRISNWQWPWSRIQSAEILLDVVFLIWTVVIVAKAFKHRRKTGE